MISAFSQRFDMVYLFHRHKLSVLETLLTQRMLLCIGVTDAFPCSAVLAVDVGAALVFVVLAAFLHTVLFTKLSFTEVGAAGVRAGAEWSLGHSFTSFGHKKSPTGLFP